MRRTTTKREHPAVILDVGQLAEEHRAGIEKMLVEGGTIEDAAECVRSAGGPEIEPEAVARFFDGRGDLQKERAQRLIEAMKAVKEAGQNGGEAGAQLMDAAIMTGLMRTRRGMSRLSVREAINARIHRESLVLKKENIDMKVRQAQQAERLNTQRIEHEMARVQLLKAQTAQLVKIMEGDKQNLKPALIDKIHEIYGLANLPEIPEAATSEE